MAESGVLKRTSASRLSGSLRQEAYNQVSLGGTTGNGILLKLAALIAGRDHPAR